MFVVYCIHLGTAKNATDLGVATDLGINVSMRLKAFYKNI